MIEVRYQIIWLGECQAASERHPHVHLAHIAPVHEPGLMDWGNVGQMNMGMALAGCLTFAEPDYLVTNLDHLFALFIKVYEESGGGRLDSATIKDHFALLIASTSPMWLLDVPVLLERHIPDLADFQDRFDP